MYIYIYIFSCNQIQERSENWWIAELIFESKPSLFKNSCSIQNSTLPRTVRGFGNLFSNLHTVKFPLFGVWVLTDTQKNVTTTTNNRGNSSTTPLKSRHSAPLERNFSCILIMAKREVRKEGEEERQERENIRKKRKEGRALSHFPFLNETFSWCSGSEKISLGVFYLRISVTWVKARRQRRKRANNQKTNK